MASYDPAAVSASADPAAAAMSTSAASAVAKGKGGAMYHCDYCRTDISSQVRIRCAECTDFDLCLDCFCAGVRVPPHVPSHSYRVIEHVRQPLFDERWGADEELLLLEAIEMFGFGNWSDIAEHVSTKTKTECETHYNQTYLASPAAPLPDITTALTNKQQQLDGGSVKHEDDAAQQTAGMKVEGSSSLPTPAAAASSSSGAIDSKDLKPASTAAAASTSTSSASATTKSGKPVSAPLPSRPKPKSGLGHLVGYIPNRGDFDQEYENDAELLLADMEFKEEDTKWEKELKLKVLDIYNSKLDARLERKKFILERGLLERKEKKRGKEEREIWNNMRVFARFHSAEEHEQFVQGLVNEARLRRRIERLQQWRMNGVKTLKDGEKYEEEKKRREDRKAANGGAAGSSAFGSSAASSLGGSKKRPAESEEAAGGAAAKSSKPSASASASPTPTPATLPPFPVESCEQVELLSEREKQLCATLHLLPVHYLAIKQRLMSECFVRGFIKEGQARQLIRIDVNKTKELFDFFVSVGWVVPGKEAADGTGGAGTAAAEPTPG